VLDQAELLGAIDLPEMRPQLYLTADERAEANRLWNDAAAPGALKLIVGCGAGQPGKIWPAARVARALREVTAALQGERRLNILLLGGAADRVSADQIITNGPPGIRSLCGEASLRVSFALAEQADVALTNASMLFHVAAAFHRPTVTVLGPFFAEDYGDDHDKLWGYPPPYSSVGPTNGTWPSVEAVVAKLVAAAHASERILA
jgi:ADP-heptose:LPS heptosyltransferase